MTSKTEKKRVKTNAEKNQSILFLLIAMLYKQVAYIWRAGTQKGCCYTNRYFEKQNFNTRIESIFGLSSNYSNYFAISASNYVHIFVCASIRKWHMYDFWIFDVFLLLRNISKQSFFVALWMFACAPYFIIIVTIYSVSSIHRFCVVSIVGSRLPQLFTCSSLLHFLFNCFAECGVNMCFITIISYIYL